MEKINEQAQEDFVIEFNNLLNNKEVDIYFIDAMHPQHNVKTGRAWIKKGLEFFIPEGVAPPPNTGRRRLNIHGALNIRTKEIITLFQNTVNQEGALELLKELRKRSGEREIYIISDNASYYRAKSIQEYAASNNAIMVYLPPYSPNLNIIERYGNFLEMKF